MREHVDSFLNYLTAEKGYSENTIMAYRNDLSSLADFASRELGKKNHRNLMVQF